MKELLATSPEAGMAAQRALALPEHAWPRRLVRDGPWLLRKLVATLLAMYGALHLVASVWRVSGHPSPIRWFTLVESIGWIVFAAGVWSGASSRVRKIVAALMILEGLHQLRGFAFPFEAHSVPSWTRLVTLLACLCVGIDVWRGREWARRACMVLGLASYGYGLASYSLMWTWFRDWMSPFEPIFLAFAAMAGLMLVGPSIALAIYSVLPSTRASFAEAERSAARSD